MKRITLFILMILTSFTLIFINSHGADSVTFTEGDWTLSENSIPFEFVHDEINEKLYVKSQDYDDTNITDFDMFLLSAYTLLNDLNSYTPITYVSGANTYNVEFTITTEAGTTFSDYDYSRLYISTDNLIENTIFLPRNKGAIRISFDIIFDLTIVGSSVYIDDFRLGSIYRQFVGEPKQVLINNNEWKQVEIYFSTSEFEFDTEQVNYPIEFLENRKWNLDTGLLETDVNFRSSNRMAIPVSMYVEFNQKIYLNNLYFHHMLFWNEYGQYIGYYNTLNTTYQGSMYLGDTDIEVAPPSNAKWFAVVSDKLGVNRVYSELNDNSLVDVFATYGMLLDSEQLVTNGDFSDGTSGWNATNNSLTVSDGILNVTVTTPNTSGNSFITGQTTTLNATKYYTYFQVKPLYTTIIRFIRGGYDSGTSEIITANVWNNISYIYTTSNTSSALNINHATSLYSVGQIWLVDNVVDINISTLITNKQYSPLYATTFDLMSDAQIKAQMDLWVQEDYGFIDYDTLGWYPTQEELETYHDLFLYYAQWGGGLSALSFYTVAPYYLRQLTYDDDRNVSDRIDGLFDGLALGSFGKVLIAVLLMIVIGIGMALMKVPFEILWLLEVVLFLLFSILGWFPLWLIILLAILLLINIFLIFKK